MSIGFTGSDKIKVGIGCLTNPSPGLMDSRQDGAELAKRCLNEINVSGFTPCLCILLATPAFQASDTLLTGIREELARRHPEAVPLIGCSVSACIHDGAAFDRGAVLVCMATDMLEVNKSISIPISAGPNTQELAKAFVDEVGSSNRERLILCFWPGEDGPQDFDVVQFFDHVHRQLQKKPGVQDKSGLGGFVRLTGGGSVPTPGSTSGNQYLNDQVLTNSIVAVVLSIDLAHASGIQSALRPKGVALRSKEENGDYVTQFEDVSGTSIDFDTWKPFALETTDVRRRIIHPIAKSADKLKIPIRPPRNAVFNVVEPTSDSLLASSLQLSVRLQRELSGSYHRFACVLAFRDVQRYVSASTLGYDIPKHLASIPGRRSYVGAFLHTPVGLDAAGVPQVVTWSAADTIICDEMSEVSQWRRHNDALSKHMLKMASADTVRDAMTRSLDCLKDAGFDKAMISLIYEDGEATWIVAYEARGKSWKDIVKPNTRRRLGTTDRPDILAFIVARDRVDDGSLYIHNAPIDDLCDQELARRAGVISFFVSPLDGISNDPFGVLQIDLGDRRSKHGPNREPVIDEQGRTLPKATEQNLEVLSKLVATSLACAIQREQLTTARRLDELLTKCMTAIPCTEESAVTKFLKEVATLIGVEEAHVRVRTGDTNELTLFAGIGDYYEAAVIERLVINCDGGLESQVRSSCAAFDNELVVVNDAANDPSYQTKIDHYKGSLAGDALRRILSFSDVVIKDEFQKAIGVVCFGSHESWFFTQSKINSLRDASNRLSTLIRHIRERNLSEDRRRRQEFLMAISPAIRPGIGGYQALKDQVTRTRVASSAETASLYLMDSVKGKLVLRAQDGWAVNDKWIEAAAYSLEDTLPGVLVKEDDPIVIASLRRFIRENRVEGWLHHRQMFSQSPDLDYALLAIPLHFAEELGPLGILLLHKSASQSIESWVEFFSANKNQLLKEVQEVLSVAVAAVKAIDRNDWMRKDLEKCSYLSREIFQPNLLERCAVLDRFANVVLDVNKGYGFREVAVYAGTSAVDLHLDFYRGRIGNGDDAITVGIRTNEISEIELQLVRQVIKSGECSEWHEPEPMNDQIPKSIAKAGWVTRVAIPIFDGIEKQGTTRTPNGVVFMRWEGLRRQEVHQLLPMHNLVGLKELVQRLSVALVLKDLMRRGYTAAISIAGMGLELTEDFHDQLNDARDLDLSLKALLREIKDEFQLEPHGTLIPKVCECIRICNSFADKYAEILRVQDSLADASSGPVEIDKLIGLAIDSHRPTFCEKSLQTETADVEGVIVDGIRTHLLLAIRNMVSNAAKFATRKSTVTFVCRRDGEDCVLTIANVGEFDRVKVDELRAHSRTTSIDDIKRRGLASGFGIAITELILWLHGGGLDFHRDGETTTVVMRIGRGADASSSGYLELQSSRLER